MVGVWEGLNLGSIPNDHMPSQKDPKISIEMRCSTILPSCWQQFDAYLGVQARFLSWSLVTIFHYFAAVTKLNPD